MKFPRRSVLGIAAAGAVVGCVSVEPIVPTVAPDVDFTDAKAFAVRLTSFDFMPEQFQLEAGREYGLTLTNASDRHHNFAAPEFFAAARVRPADASKIVDGKVELKAGETAVVHLIPTRGRYNLICTHTGHALLGMDGEITVS